MTSSQQRTVEYLQAEADNLEIVPDPDSDDLVFAGDDADGLIVGHIRPDGAIDWITGRNTQHPVA